MAYIHKDNQYSMALFPDGWAWGDSFNFSYSSFGHHNIGMSTNVWQHVAFTKTGGVVTIYRNGASRYSTPFGPGLAITSNLLCIGAYCNGSTPAYSTDAGNLDELRISNVARSADWILTEYRNQSAPGTYVSAGPRITPGRTGRVRHTVRGGA